MERNYKQSQEHIAKRIKAMSTTLRKTNRGPHAKSRVCTRCRVRKPSSQFKVRIVRKTGKPDWFGRVSNCTKCLRELARISHHTNRERNLERNYPYRLKRKYGISLIDYQAKHLAQDGLCKICEQPPQKRRLVVDHNHETGQVRDLLCDRCNLGLFLFENLSLRAAAIAYLDRHTQH